MTSTIDEILSLFKQHYINLGDSTEGKLLIGVARALGERGASETTVQDILDEAGLSRRTFYQFFQNKEDALDALFSKVSSGMIHAIEALIADEEDPTEAALKICELYLSLQLATGKGALALHAEATRPESRLFARREAVLDTMSGLIARRIEAQRGAAIDPLVVRAVLLGVEGAVVHLKRRGEFDDRAAPRIMALTRVMIGNIDAKT